MAKRAPKSSSGKVTNTTGTPSTAEPTPKARGGSRAPRRRDVASELATGQDQAAAMSDEFVGVAGDGAEPVQGETTSLSHESVSMSSGPSDEDIRMRAYHRYLERGGGHGMDFEDWVAAEDELKTRG